MSQVSLLLAAAGVVLTAFSAWYARRALLPPKRELLVSAGPSTPLLSDAASSVPDVRVSKAGADIDDPHIVSLSVTNTGRFDITASQFHDAAPLRIDLGAPIVGTLGVTTPQRTERLPVHVIGTRVEFGPGLLARDVRVEVQILTSGPPDTQTLQERTEHAIVDTEVVFRRRIALSLAKLVGFVSVMLAAGALIAFGGLNLVRALEGGKVSLAPDSGHAGDAFVVHGSRFERYATITVTVDRANGWVDSEPIASGQADRKGEFDLLTSLPRDMSPGEVTLAVNVNEGDSSHIKYLKYYVAE